METFNTVTTDLAIRIQQIHVDAQFASMAYDLIRRSGVESWTPGVEISPAMGQLGSECRVALEEEGVDCGYSFTYVDSFYGAAVHAAWSSMTFTGVRALDGERLVRVLWLELVRRAWVLWVDGREVARRPCAD